MPQLPPAQPLVAIFDSTDETVEVLARFLEEPSFQTVIGRNEEIQSGVLDLVTFLEEHDCSTSHGRVNNTSISSICWRRPTRSSGGAGS